MHKGSNLEKLELLCTAKNIFMLIGHLDILLCEVAFQVSCLFFFRVVSLSLINLFKSFTDSDYESFTNIFHFVASTLTVFFFFNFCFEIIIDLERNL